jgi:hypothetical protein
MTLAPEREYHNSLFEEKPQQRLIGIEGVLPVSWFGSLVSSAS